jgi:hypothetical protein
MYGQLDWSPSGDLAVGVAWQPAEGVFVASEGDVSAWAKVTTGSFPVWIQ